MRDNGKSDTPQVDTSTVDYVERFALEEWGGLEKIIASDKYSDEHKAREVERRSALALVDVNSRAEPILAELESNIERYRTEAAMPFSPSSDEDANRLRYTREMLSQRWINQSVMDIMTDWQVAIDMSDPIAARVFRDFSETAIRRKTRLPGERGNSEDRPGGLPPQFDDMVAKTNDLLMTGEQRNAAKKLADTQATLLAVRGAVERQRQKLTNARYQNGKIIDGIMATLPQLSL